MKQESRGKKDKSTSKQGAKLDPQAAELTEALQRAQADLVNFRARVEREKSELTDFVKSQVVMDLLPLIDNLERALTHIPKELTKNEWAQGVAAVGKQVQDALDKMGVERIKTVGEHFDPHLHEAVSVDGETGDEIINEELRSGYRLGNTVLRHAMVRVVRKSKK